MNDLALRALWLLIASDLSIKYPLNPFHVRPVLQSVQIFRTLHVDYMSHLRLVYFRLVVDSSNPIVMLRCVKVIGFSFFVPAYFIPKNVWEDLSRLALP